MTPRSVMTPQHVMTLLGGYVLSGDGDYTSTLNVASPTRERGSAKEKEAPAHRPPSGMPGSILGALPLRPAQLGMSWDFIGRCGSSSFVRLRTLAGRWVVPWGGWVGGGVRPPH